MSRRAKWTHELCVQAYDKFVQEQNRLPRAADLIGSNGLPMPTTFKHYVGQTPQQYGASRYPDQYTLEIKRSRGLKWSSENCILAYHRFVESHSRTPTGKEMNLSDALPGAMAFKRSVGMTPGKYAAINWPEKRRIGGESLRTWSKETILEAANRYVQKHGGTPETKDCNWKNQLPSRTTICTTFNMKYSEFWIKCFPEVSASRRLGPKCWTLPKIEEALDRFVAKNGHIPTQKELSKRFGLPSRGTIAKQTEEKQVALYLRTRYPAVANAAKAKWTPENIEEAINDFVLRHGRTPKAREFFPKNALPCLMTFHRALESGVQEYMRAHFPEYGDTRACHRESRWTEETVRFAMEEFMTKHGRMPLYTELLNKNGLPSAGTFKRVMGESIAMYVKSAFERLPDQAAQAEPEEEPNNRSFSMGMSMW